MGQQRGGLAVFLLSRLSFFGSTTPPNFKLEHRSFLDQATFSLHPSLTFIHDLEPRQGILDIRRIAITMFRNALRQSGRTVGAFSASSRVTAVSSNRGVMKASFKL